MSEAPELLQPVKTDIRMYFPCGCIAVRYYEPGKEIDPKWYIFPWGEKNRCRKSGSHKEELVAGAKEAWERIVKSAAKKQADLGTVRGEKSNKQKELVK